MSDVFKNFAKDWTKGDAKERCYLVLGGLFLVLAIIGIAIPLVPQVPFAVAAGFFLTKGSPTLHKWLRNNKFLGGPVKDWEDHKVVRPKLKIFSTLAMIGTAVVGHLNLLIGWAIAIDVIFGACIAFILTRKSKPRG